MKGTKLLTGLTALLMSVYLCPVTLAADSEIKVRSVEISTPTMTVRVNQTRILFAYIMPVNADVQEIEWRSSDYEVASVDDEGVVTGISPGSAVITASSADGRRSAQCVVTVPSAVLTAIQPELENRDIGTADANSGEELSAMDLRAKVEAAVREAKQGETAIVSYTGKTAVSAAALRSAAYTAAYEGGTVSLRFNTIDASGNVQGQIRFDSGIARKTETDLAPSVYTGGASTTPITAFAASRFPDGYTPVYCAQQGSYGFPVEIAVKPTHHVDSPTAYVYTCDTAAGICALVEDASPWLDTNGYIHFTVSEGGAYIIASRPLY